MSVLSASPAQLVQNEEMWNIPISAFSPSGCKFVFKQVKEKLSADFRVLLDCVQSNRIFFLDNLWRIQIQVALCSTLGSKLLTGQAKLDLVSYILFYIPIASFKEEWTFDTFSCTKEKHVKCAHLVVQDLLKDILHVRKHCCASHPEWVSREEWWWNYHQSQQNRSLVSVKWASNAR